MGKPVIGVMPQYDVQNHRLMIVSDFFHAIKKAGGIPVLLPLDSDISDVEGILERFDGFLYPGGPDINPLLFGEETRAECGNIITERDTLELGLMPGILRSGKPVLGICRGIQLMNVAFGGTLIQDIPAQWKNTKEKDPNNPMQWKNTQGKDPINPAQNENSPAQGNRIGSIGHYQKAGDTVLTHTVHVEKNTLLYDILKKERFAVNSFHHQACKTLGEGFALNASAPDGIIEAAARENHKFFLGVQWHPEHLYGIDENATRLWNAFLQNCQQ